jgi:multimeric flavodoxin WrbA
MNIIAINGSPNAKGNTRLALDLVCASLAEEGIATEVIQAGKAAGIEAPAPVVKVRTNFIR